MPIHSLAQLPPLTVDLHIDVPWQMWKSNLSQGKVQDLAYAECGLQANIPAMRAGGLNIPTFALYLSDATQESLGEEGTVNALKQQVRWLKQQPELAQVRFPQDVLRAISEGKQPYFLALEGGSLAEAVNEVEHGLDLLAEWGIVYVTLCHNADNYLCDSATSGSSGGLSSFGEAMMDELDSMDIFIDVSHTSQQTIVDVLERARTPILATHSGCVGLHSHPRNIPDHLIRAIVRVGGVVGIPFVNKFLGPYTVADHIDHVAQLAGHSFGIAVGSDLDGADVCVEDASEWGRVVMEALSMKGWSDYHIANVSGGNALRLILADF